MSNAPEWHCQYGEYFVVLKDQTEADWVVVVKRLGSDSIVTFQLAGDLQEAQAEVNGRMLRDFHVNSTSDWKPA